MGTTATLLYNITTLIAATLFFYNSTLLFITRKGNKAKRTLAFTNLIWGLLYLSLIIFDYCNIEITTFPIFSVQTLILSNVFICIMFLYPLDVVRPGWLNGKRFFYLFIPSIGISLIYFIILGILDEEIENLSSFQDLKSSILHFNVWYRFILLACNLVYCYILLKLTYYHEMEYDKWIKNKYPDQTTIDITWMNYYYHMLIVLIMFFCITVFWGSKWNIVMYNTVIICCFSVLFYKGLFHKEVYTDYSPKENIEISQPQVSKLECDTSSNNPIYTGNNFEVMIPTYVNTVKNWFEKEKTYLDQELKLADVSQILPLNRSYLSRVFNEGFGMNFNDVVRYYRIEHAKEILTVHPEYPFHKVATLCGFTSYTTFTRAFQKVMGITPKQFKIQLPSNVLMQENKTPLPNEA